MAEEKKSSSSENNEDIFDKYGIIIIIVILLIITTISSGKSFFSFEDSSNENTITEEKPKRNWDFSVTKIIGQGDLSLGDVIITNGKTQVRTMPGGSILGIQPKLSLGKIMEGPVDQFGTLWWRVNFEKAPSGWVEYNFISTKIKLIKTVNFPITLYKGFKPVGWFSSIFLLLIIFYYKFRLANENRILEKKRRVKDEMAEKRLKEMKLDNRNNLGLPTDEKYQNQRWEHVKELMKSKNQSDWRQAIIEADIILDEMLRRMSYDGLTIGDMLKQVEASDFATLDQAWEAHKFRNEIAHTGSEFVLSKDEAERVISLYQAVFDEFYFV